MRKERTAINRFYRDDETACVERLLPLAKLPSNITQRIHDTAVILIEHVRKSTQKNDRFDIFLHEYNLNSEEGIALMCIAEALLRIPDDATVDKLIKDKMTSVDWHAHVSKQKSTLVNAATWGLIFTAKLSTPTSENHLTTPLKRMMERLSEPMIRRAMQKAIRLLGEHFVLGETITQATERAHHKEQQGFRYSYDMLGEAARTADDATVYFKAYQEAIAELARHTHDKPGTLIENPNISVKLSSLTPRYTFSKHAQAVAALTPLLKQLSLACFQANIGLTIDAEEASQLDIALDVLEALIADPDLADWRGLGLAVQAYQKRAYAVIAYLAELANQHAQRLRVRLVKGAYWDNEIKWSQAAGLDYPVFTRKAATDVSYLACAKKLLAHRDVLYPQFATHNAYTVAAILEMNDEAHDFEFQALHGMGETLYERLIEKGIACRIYAPVGNHQDLLSYLVRRLLENGANSSFLNKIFDDSIPISVLTEDPVAFMQHVSPKSHPHIPAPKHLFGDARLNAIGFDLSDRVAHDALQKALSKAWQTPWHATPLIPDEVADKTNTPPEEVLSPSTKQAVGDVVPSSPTDIDHALSIAQHAANSWNNTPAKQRAHILQSAANLLEEHMPTLIALAVNEAGKTLANGVAEVREAVDFCRYYAHRAVKDFAEPIHLPGPVGENNQLRLCGRGVIACISPWNFPLAIFMGQVSAALAAGNCVVAKPAEQTPLIASEAVKILHQAGVPKEVLQLLPGDGDVGAALIADPRVNGVVFTGSTDTARHINKSLADRPGPIIPLIAETGGQNAMMVDSSALLEQVVPDIIYSAFDSAGQRCSALRTLFVQEDIAEPLLTMLRGAMAEIVVGDPALLQTDVGPVIDEAALDTLQKHAAHLDEAGKLLYEVEIPEDCPAGHFFAPRAYEIDFKHYPRSEVFGPILHIIRYEQSALDKVIDTIHSTGYGLTFGIHSRINETIDYIQQRMHVGNLYINRNTVGAVVGSQPFGGEGLSGTGPKAGGPFYLHRLAVERSVCNNLTAVGGNASLLCLPED